MGTPQFLLISWWKRDLPQGRGLTAEVGAGFRLVSERRRPVMINPAALTNGPGARWLGGLGGLCPQGQSRRVRLEAG